MAAKGSAEISRSFIVVDTEKGEIYVDTYIGQPAVYFRGTPLFKADPKRDELFFRNFADLAEGRSVEVLTDGSQESREVSRNLLYIGVLLTAFNMMRSTNFNLMSMSKDHYTKGFFLVGGDGKQLVGENPAQWLLDRHKKHHASRPLSFQVKRPGCNECDIEIVWRFDPELIEEVLSFHHINHPNLLTTYYYVGSYESEGKVVPSVFKSCSHCIDLIFLWDKWREF